MEIVLHSNDPELHKLCRDIVRLTPGARCTVRADLKKPVSAAPTDVCIYDTALGSLEDLPEQNDVGSVILIVSRAELPQIRTKMLHLRAIILLRPVNRARLEIAIEQSLTHPRYTVDCDLMRISRDELLECLLRANLRLQEYDQDRSHFVARAIHELRAPLTSLNGYCGLLLDGKLGALSPEQTNALTRMRRSLDRLGRSVSAMFDLSAGQNGEAKPDQQVGNIIECVEQALHEVEPMLQERRIQLSVSFQQPAGEVSFNAQQMEQVFVSLLENSCKFSRRGGVVDVTGYPYFWERRISNGKYSGDRRRAAATDSFQNSYRIDIADNGPGIPPDRLERIFAESTVSAGGNDRSGTGLGLAIARLFMRQHKGHVWAESKSSTETKFCVVVPHAMGTEVDLRTPERPSISSQRSNLRDFLNRRILPIA